MRKQTKLVAVLSAAALLAIGASMTSFAATRGWVQEGEDWVYLDSNGDRVYNEWKRSGDYYYYLGEDGIMAKDQLVHDTTIDAYYYVDENGTRVMNAWKALPNDEGVQVGDNTPEILYYYFGSAGKANRATDDDLAIKSVNGKNYAFDTEGRMASGWQWVHVKNNANTEALYYFGTDEEGWARTGWQQLEPGENMREDEYDDLEWYYFESNGRAVRSGSKYINGKYYAFDDFGVMRDDWYDVSTAPTAASAGIAFASGNGTLANGWAYTNPKGQDDADDYWFYLITLRDGKNVKRSVPFNYYGTGYDTEYTGEKAARAKVIKNKTYIFDTDGQMLTGFVVIDGVDGEAASAEIKQSADTKAGDDSVTQIFTAGATENGFTKEVYGAKPGDITHGINARALETGLYYFNETDGSQNGQLMTGRTAVTKDGETFYYYFNKTGNQNTAVNYGKALTSTVKDGYLYGKDGKCLTADDGNSYALYRVSEIEEGHYATATDLPSTTVTTKTDGIKIAGKTTIIDSSIPAGADEGVDAAYVVVSQSGRIKQSGTATIDGVRYTIKDYKVINTKAID